jgi:mannose-6-phosphate isomerase-like protein (cupin superfamily)
LSDPIVNAGMGYRVVDTTEVEATPDRPSRHRGLVEPGELTNMAINRFEAEPGEMLPLAYHYHDDQQEAFFVLRGELHVETPEGTYEVGADELFVADPESPQRAYNPEVGDETAHVLAIGAPAVDDVHPYEP